jgi:alkanesulfonate monooxygenase
MTTGLERPAPRFDWFIPIDGDGAHIGTLQAERPPTFETLKQIVLAAEGRGFYSLLIPTRFANGLFDEAAPLAETWTMVTALAAVTSRIRFLVAVRPGFIATGLFAKMAATLSDLSGGRIDLNVVPGGIQGDFERFGEVSDHDTRYERAEEFIEALRVLWATPQPVHYDGRFIQLNGAICSPGPVGAGPKFYLGGASPAALGLAGRQADVYLGWIQPQEQVAAHLSRARAAFAAAGRPACFGLRSHLIVRDTEDAAWAAAENLLSQAAEQVKAQRRAVMVGTPMVGQQAQAQVVADHRLGRHLWNGISTVRVNCGSALVGTPEQVAHELLDYWRLGIDEFILSGYPHLEECHRTAAGLIPLTQALIERERQAA